METFIGILFGISLKDMYLEGSMKNQPPEPMVLFGTFFAVVFLFQNLVLVDSSFCLFLTCVLCACAVCMVSKYTTSISFHVLLKLMAYIYE